MQASTPNPPVNADARGCAAVRTRCLARAGHRERCAAQTRVTHLKNIALLGLLFASLATAGGTAPRHFALPDHGVFEITVPVDWQEQIRRPPNRLPPTIKFHPKAGSSFEVLMTPLWPIEGKAPPTDAATIRKEVKSAAARVSSQAVEKQIEVHELKGSNGTGYYFSATDKAPNPGEYKYMTQGILPVGRLVVTFTILTNDGRDSAVTQSLKALQSAANRK
jgi:hypothetical protein